MTRPYEAANSTRWHVCRRLAPPLHTVEEVGFNLGIASFATLSTGEQLPVPNAGRSAHQRVKRLQRVVDRLRQASHCCRKEVRTFTGRVVLRCEHDSNADNYSKCY